ncbi:hypothetical protein DRW48_01890 [Paracoccus suum]|uniref:Phosphomannomutase n=1 Tax=Paracoccus suum TaxID=2259340 RepID=A0A344PGV6_9RHOB|nr:hypothetical protein [Paracoccus suum]AXC48611.1 hypothetical protein DRW48_01890 [Paracoccus suum]
MFTIEHEFDATVITLVDEGHGEARPLEEDVVILGFDDRVVIEQPDPLSGLVRRITLSMAQLADLRAALDLPEGSYRLRPRG